MPKNSSHCLPKSYQKEMLSENSPLSDYYPSDFKSDLYLGDVEWKSIVLLPFIDSTRLRNVTSELPLDEAEQVRNQFKFSKIFFNLNPNTEKTFNEINNQNDFALYSFDNVQGWLKTVGKNSPFGKIIKSPVPNEKYPDIKCESHSAFFVNPCSENEYKANLFPLLNKSIQKDGVSETNDSVEESQPVPKKKVVKKKSTPIQEEEEEESVPKKKVVKKKVVQEEMEEESIEESQPVPKKKVVKKKSAPIQEEEEEESVEPVPKKKVVKKKKVVQEEEIVEPVPKKKVVKKKAVKEEMEEEPIEESQSVPKKKVVKKKSASVQEEIAESVPKKKVVKKKAAQEEEEESVEPIPKKKVVKKKKVVQEEEIVEPVPKKKVVKKNATQDEMEEVSTKKRKLSNGSEEQRKKIKI
jgi:hypothetical protein